MEKLRKINKPINKNNKKKILFILILGGVLLTINTVFALYYFTSFSFTFSVEEPFTTYYATVDADYVDYEGVKVLGCQLMGYYLNWTEVSSGGVDIGDKYIGEEGMVCFRVDSTAGEDIDLDFQMNGDWDENVNWTDFIFHYGSIQEGEISSTVPSEGQLWGLLVYEVGTGANGDYQLDVDFSRE